ncbi:PREDICTED: uncharacterized protein LOC106791753 [Polistes canadensis]|uniref:uncharacterized protein LOC106791753 n=1 Tax=Polistes canadensis TaxID=91411 RepID=UPI000718DAF4|nr:PREDICTED: uncharacterized protein LOC106791753 [Polistes canadensis]
MLTAKHVKVHKMSDERWTKRDKINQYRGVLKLYEYRGIVHDVVTGNKTHLLAILQQYDNFHLAFGQLSKDEIHDRIYQNSELYHRQLDKIRYEKEKLAKQYFDLQVEKCVLLEEEGQEVQTDHLHQRLSAHLQRSTAKQNGAKAIRTTYITMINILKKDTVYFDALLNALKDDQKDQCKVIVKATVMGQLGAENVDDLKEKYKIITRDVLKHMKERERTLITARERVTDLWGYAKSLVRIESNEALIKKNANFKGKSDHLESQLKRLEEICEILKDTVLVRSHNELFPRLEEQMKQKKRLINQFNYNIKERNNLVIKKEESIILLEKLEHTMLSTTGQYRIDKKALLEEIEAQKKRIGDYKELRRSHGELSMKIRAALQNMLLMLVCIKRGKVERRQLKKTKSIDELDEDEPILDKIEPDGY